MSTFTAINTALSGLIAQQQAIDVASNNVANVNTTGYSRQEAVLQADISYSTAANNGISLTGGQVGVGVDVATIRQLQNNFLSQQNNSVSGQVGRWTTAQSYLNQIQNIMAPGNTLDLSSTLSNFFGAWQTLATNPTDQSSRNGVLSAAQNLTGQLNQINAQLDTVANTTGSDLQQQVENLNHLSDQLATLNEQIGAEKAAGVAPNTLLDSRASILNQMSQLAGVTSLSNGDMSSVTNLGGHALVQGSKAYHLQVVPDATGNQVIWADSGDTATINSGEIGGLLEVRNTVVPTYQQQLNDLTLALASGVNNLYGTGVTPKGNTAGNFFQGTTAGTIQVDPSIAADSTTIASTTTAGAVGDGSLASSIYALYTTPLVGNQTLNQNAQALTGQIGTAVSTANTNVDASKALQTQITGQVQQISGVSLDEEMSHVLIYQQAYSASAHVLTTVNQMVQTLLDQVGR